MQKSVIEQISKGINKGRELFGNIAAGRDFEVCAESSGSELCRGDNLVYMENLLERGYSGRFKMIYIDPPFFTRNSFNAAIVLKDKEGKSHRINHLAYDDKFDRNLEYYIENMTVRLMLMRELLSDEGVMWIHLDWHSSHYIRLVMDEILGEKNFINEIIWCYKSGGSGKKHFARKHDSILLYSKTGKYELNIPQEKSYNRDYKPYRFRNVKEYRDEVGWYTMVNMKDVWNMDMVGRTSSERTGYATQKPVELMKRILECCTDEGDLAGDFFCGSGSLPVAAEAMGRKWMCCDSELLATSMSFKRLSSMGANFSYIRKDDTRPQTGRVSFKVKGREALQNGKFLYKCILSEMIPDADIGRIRMCDRKLTEKVLMEDGMAFLDYVVVKLGGDDETGEFVICDNLPEMSFVAGSDFSLYAVDVFGKEYAADVDFDAI